MIIYPREIVPCPSESGGFRRSRASAVRRPAPGRILCCCVAWVLSGSIVFARAESGFTRIGDPAAPVVDISATAYEMCGETRSIDIEMGKLNVRYPGSCGPTMDPLVDLLADGFSRLRTLVPPRDDGSHEWTVLVLDGRQLPANLRFRSDEPNTDVVLAPHGCEEEGWWRWEEGRAVISYVFHEATHALVGRRLPDRTPLWIVEGHASYVAYRIDEALFAATGFQPARGIPLMARFVGTPWDGIERLFRRRRSFAMRPAAAGDAVAAYDLYLGAFLASDELELSENVFRTVTAAIASDKDKTKKRRLRSLRDLSPECLHESSQALRENLISAASSKLALRPDDAQALAALRWLGVERPAEAEGDLGGVTVRDIWSAANFMNPRWFFSEPSFEEEGARYVGAATHVALGPDSDLPLGLVVTWTVSLVEDEQPALERHFTLPADAKFAVTTTFDLRESRRVETYTVVSERDGALVSTHLGFKRPDGTVVVSTAPASLGRVVFEELGMRGPFRRRIFLPVEDGAAP